jgi:hypothetical protein
LRLLVDDGIERGAAASREGTPEPGNMRRIELPVEGRNGAGDLGVVHLHIVREQAVDDGNTNT